MIHPEGTITREETSSGDTYTYNYFKTDHMGSTRAMLSAVDGTLQASQRTDYYPFGLSFENNNLNKNKYLFSGKEFQDGQVNGSMLGWYDFGARFYDPVLGRWFNMDPASQVANPYLFCGNSPMMYVDKDGRIFWLIPAIAIGAAIGAASYTMSIAFSEGGFQNWNWGGFFKSIGIGTASGAITSGIGQIFPAMSQLGTLGEKISNEFGRGFMHGMVQGGASALGGDDFLSGFASGALGSWAGHGFQAWEGVGDTGLGAYAMGGLSGGLGAAAMGGNFWKGMGQGMITTGLNAAAWHSVASLDGELPNYSGKRMADGSMGGCVHATWKSILEYLGFTDLANSIEIKPKGATLDGVAEEYGFGDKPVAESEVIKKIAGDVPVAMEYLPVSSDMGHAVAIQSVQVRMGKYRYQVMDPDYGKVRPLELKHVRGANYRIAVVVQ